MPTTRGWTLIGLAAGVGVLWWLFGEDELLAASVTALVALVLGALWLSVPSLDVTRLGLPAATPVGSSIRLELHLANTGRLPLPVMLVSDPVTGLGTATASLAGIAPGARSVIPYQLDAHTRGIHRVGPVQATVRDPLGLTERRLTVGTGTVLVVHPRVERLSGLPTEARREQGGRVVRSDPAQRTGTDFYTIREFRHGDDLRMVHWPTSAHRDDLMIRQLETPHSPAAGITLDTRDVAYEDDAAFESAVSGVASIHHHLVDHGFEVTVRIGAETLPVGAPQTAVLGRFASVTRSDASDVRPGPRVRDDLLRVVVTGTLDAPLLELARSHRIVVVSHTSPEIPPGARVLHVTPGGSWAQAWRRISGEMRR